MTKYQWKLSEIIERKKYILERLKANVSKEEKEKLELSLISCICLFNNSGSIRYTKFYNLIDKISNNRFSLSKNEKYGKIEHRLFFEQPPFLDDSYLEFLMQLASNISREITEEINFSPLNLSSEELANISKNFYSQFGDSEIEEKARKIIDDPTALNITNAFRDGYQDYGGITYNDYIFNKSYCTMTKNNSIYDIQILNHEVMHGIDFYMHQKLPSKNYYGFHEVPTYTIDYLLIDYLEQMGFDSAEVNKLRKQKFDYLSYLASLTLTQINRQLIMSKGLKGSKDANISDIRKILNPQLIRQLLEIQSGIIAYGLAKQLSTNRQLGINNLKTFIKNDIDKNQKPDISFIGLSDQQLLDLSIQYRENVMNLSSNNINGKSR